MENEKGILQTLLIVLQSQVNMEKRLFDFEIAYRAHRDSVLAHLPEDVHESCRTRFDDLHREAIANGSPDVEALRQAIAEIQHLLTKKG